MVQLIWFFVAILTFPTHIAQLLPFLMRRSPPPIVIYLSSLLTNIGIALLISIISINYDTDDVLFLIYFIAGMFSYGFGVIFSFFYCICCCNNFDISDDFNDELYADFDNYNKFSEKIAKNRSFPPNIFVNGEAYHFETTVHSYYDSYGRLNHEYTQEKVVTYRNSFQLKYSTWQEEGNPITLTKGISLIHGHIYCQFKFDDETIEIINKMRQIAFDDARPHDAYINVYNIFSVPGMYDKICGTTCPSDVPPPCATKWIPTLGGRILIGFLKFLGYSTLIYSCWSSIGINMKMTLVKNISMKQKNEGGLRCKFMELDKDAVRTAFHCNKPKVIPFQPQFNYAQFQENLDSLCRANSNIVSGINHDGQLNIIGDSNKQGYGHIVNNDNNSNLQNIAEISPYVNNIDKTQIPLRTNDNLDSLYSSLINND